MTTSNNNNKYFGSTRRYNLTNGVYFAGVLILEGSMWATRICRHQHRYQGEAHRCAVEMASKENARLAEDEVMTAAPGDNTNRLYKAFVRKYHPHGWDHSIYAGCTLREGNKRVTDICCHQHKTQDEAQQCADNLAKERNNKLDKEKNS